MGEEEFNQFDESRIINGEVSLEERIELSEKLIQMFANKVAKEEKKLNYTTDRDHYRKLKESGVVFDGEEYYVLVDENEKLLDMNPVVYHLVDTPEGKFYGKLMLYSQHPSS